MSNESFTGSVGETRTMVFDFSEDLLFPRESDYQYALTEFIQIGAFVYECTNAGKTAKESPEFTTTIGQTTNDGSVEWTCRDFSASGTDIISTRVLTPGTGLSVDSSAIEKNTRVRVTFTLTAAGLTNLLCQVATAAGETAKQTLDVVVT